MKKKRKSRGLSWSRAWAGPGLPARLRLQISKAEAEKCRALPAAFRPSRAGTSLLPRFVLGFRTGKFPSWVVKEKIKVMLNIEQVDFSIKEGFQQRTATAKKVLMKMPPAEKEDILRKVENYKKNGLPIDIQRRWVFFRSMVNLFQLPCCYSSCHFPLCCAVRRAVTLFPPPVIRQFGWEELR